MTRLQSILAIASATAGFASAAAAQTTAPETAPATAATATTAPSEPPCADPAFRQLDFWVGEWDLSWALPNGGRGEGRSVITRDEYGDCVIYERFAGGGFTGMSVSTFHAGPGKWRQTWVDDQGGYYALVGGPASGEDHDFELVDTRLSDDAPRLRMIWQDVTADSLVWRWQRQAEEGGPWVDLWVIDYIRSTADERAPD
ncbi:MAG: hypothetical protein GC152_06090 [Alphaproteobacteria bacterium]|nr:hypothetical protein [Alphaproteobacteria bacterium]